MSTADQLTEREHYAADEIEARCADLQEKWAELTSLSATRQQNLQESQKAQQVRKKDCLRPETRVREREIMGLFGGSLWSEITCLLESTFHFVYFKFTSNFDTVKCIESLNKFLFDFKFTDWKRYRN